MLLLSELYVGYFDLFKLIIIINVMNGKSDKGKAEFVFWRSFLNSQDDNLVISHFVNVVLTPPINMNLDVKKYIKSSLLNTEMHYE